MDAKSKANFINSVVNNKKVICSKCGAQNDSDAKFCALCGTSVALSKTEPIHTVSEDTPVNPVPEKIIASVKKTAEHESVFAEGLPAWSIEPPQMTVRRKRR